MPRSACFAALCAVVLLIGSASVSNAAKGIEDVDVALYGVHEPPFQYSLLEQDAASINAYHPARDGEGMPSRPTAAFPFDAPALPADFPVPRSHFETAAPHMHERNPYNSNEYARNAVLMEQQAQLRGSLRMPVGVAGMAPRALYQPAPVMNVMQRMPMQQQQMYYAAPPVMMAPQPQLTAVAVPIQVPVAASSAPVLVEQKATTKQEPELNDAIPAQGTVPMESDADSVADAPESRFAQQSGSGSSSMSTDSATDLAKQASASSVGLSAGSGSAAPMAGSSSSAGDVDGNAPPAAPQGGKGKARLYKCNPAGTHCKVRFGNDIKWKMVTVPKLPSDPSSQSQSGSNSQGSSSGSGSGSEAQAPQPQFSDNPEIARLQRAYYEKQAEIVREQKWVASVRKIIAEYQTKLSNVARHTLVDKASLRQQEKDIAAAIRKERQAKLEVELRAALESLQKLESTSSALSSKVSDLTSTKLNLRKTISRIQRAMGRTISANVQSAASSLLEVNGAAQDQDADLSDKQDASDGAKKLFSSLLQLLETREKASAEADSGLHSHDGHHRTLAHRKLRGHVTRPEPEQEEKHSDVDDINLLETNGDAFDARVQSIASKYADEERDRLDADLPLSTLALRDKHDIDKELDD